MESPGIKGQHLSVRLRGVLTKLGFREEYFLVFLSIIIGSATGVSARLFFDLMEVARVFAYGDGEVAGLFAGRLWMLVVLPMVGGLGVGLITYFFAREAKGHGVPEVLDAIHRGGGRIRPRVAAAKTVASALTIGSGGSAGMEGPIIQIGAALGSTVGQFLHLDRRQLGIVIACGVAAGIAAIFNAPIAGVLFALEIFLQDFSFRAFSPVVFSSVLSCSVMHATSSQDVAIFEVEALRSANYVFAGLELPWFLILGLISALAAVAFIKVLYLIEDVTDRVRVPEAIKPAIGGLLMGLSGIAFLTMTQGRTMPPFFGNGYTEIQATLGPELVNFTVVGLLLLAVLKLAATSLTLGTGGSGGIFAPSLMMGAALGGAFGMILHHAGMIPENSMTAYSLVGMAAVVAGTTHAPLTAIVMSYEITREPRVVLPVMFAAIIATAGARWLSEDSIYTLKLRRRGVRIGGPKDLTVLRRISVEDVPWLTASCLSPDDPLRKLLDLAAETEATDFVVLDDTGRYVGMVSAADVRTALLQPESVSLLLVGELVRPGIPMVSPNETLDVVLDKFTHGEVASLPVSAVGGERAVQGLVTRRGVMRRYREELDRLSS